MYTNKVPSYAYLTKY